METINELIYYYSQNAGYVWEQFYRHFLMAAYGVLFAAIVGIPLGITHCSAPEIESMGDVDR